MHYETTYYCFLAFSLTYTLGIPHKALSCSNRRVSLSWWHSAWNLCRGWSAASGFARGFRQLQDCTTRLDDSLSTVFILFVPVLLMKVIVWEKSQNIFFNSETFGYVIDRVKQIGSQPADQITYHLTKVPFFIDELVGRVRIRLTIININWKAVNTISSFDEHPQHS